MSPAVRAATAPESSPAGHGKSASTAGPVRSDAADSPEPAQRCHAHAVATGDVSVAANSHTAGSLPASVPPAAPADVGVMAVTGTPGSSSPAGSASASSTFV